jgi:hypothetical protein
VPNAFNEQFCKKLKVFPPQNEKIILWRGGHSHIEDLMLHADSIIRFKKDNPDWTFCFYGLNPFFLKKNMPYEYIPFCDDLHTYFQSIQEIQPKIQMVALTDTVFNRAKSNISWIEGTFAGAVTVAPATLAEFNRPGVIPYEDLYGGLRMAANMPDRKEQLRISREYIGNNLLLNHVNKQREALLRDLIG